MRSSVYRLLSHRRRRPHGPCRCIERHILLQSALVRNDIVPLGDDPIVVDEERVVSLLLTVVVAHADQPIPSGWSVNPARSRNLKIGVARVTLEFFQDI